MSGESDTEAVVVYRRPVRGKLRPGAMVVRREFFDASAEISLLWLPDVGQGDMGPVYKWLVPVEAAQVLAAALLNAARVASDPLPAFAADGKPHHAEDGPDGQRCLDDCSACSSSAT